MSNNLILIEELNKLADDQSTISYKEIRLLLDAINDWPDSVNSVEQFLTLLKVDLNCDQITYDEISKIKFQSTLSNAWKVECYASLLELMTLHKGKSLDAILSDLKNST